MNRFSWFMKIFKWFWSGPKSFGSPLRMFFSASISWIFMNIIFVSYIDFGPNRFSWKKGRNRVYRLKIWAEVDVWKTLITSAKKVVFCDFCLSVCKLLARFSCNLVEGCSMDQGKWLDIFEHIQVTGRILELCFMFSYLLTLQDNVFGLCGGPHSLSSVSVGIFTDKVTLIKKEINGCLIQPCGS